LADEKITYQKSLSNFQEVNAVGEFQIVMEKYANLEMINLAIESGKFSRFCLDKRMPKGKFEELYGLWIQNSVSGNFADAVIICKIDNIIGGLVTLANKNRVGDIGIIAVDESYRGIGIGKALMRAAENWFIENKYLISQVVTQEVNKPAKQLYEKCGFEIVKREFVYHIWMNS
jgi:dTDP-4-amino-4,6-dideoxy-D-galactose acyltransferase